MKKRYKIGLVVIGLLAAVFFAFQMPHNDSVSTVLAQENDDPLPMTADGLVDYLTITNRQLNKNVTVDSNVVVDIVQAFGTDRYLPEEIKESFLTLLGNPEIPEDGFYEYVHSWAQKNSDDELDIDLFTDQVINCYDTPWKESEHPMIAEWLTEFDTHLDDFVRASKKPHYFHPLCETNGVVVGALLPYCQVMRETARGLSLRAMNELEKGNVSECLNDLAAIRRLGKLLEQGGTLIENLVGYAMLGIAFEAEKSVLEQLANAAPLSSADIEAYRKVIRETSDLALLSNTMRRGEKAFMLDCVQRLESGKSTDFLSAFGVDPQNHWTANTTLLFAKFTDWKVVLDKCEQFSEQMIGALEIEDDLLRHAALRALESELEEKDRRKSSVSSTVLRVAAGARSRGDFAADILLGMFTPAVMQVDAARMRTSSYDIADLGFALELYRREHGQFPNSLNELTPQFIKSVPLDPFEGAPIKYNSKMNGYRIWNIGVNRTNDQIDSQGNLIELEPDDADSMDSNLRFRSDDVLIDVRN